MDSQSQIQLNRQVANLYKKAIQSDSIHEENDKLHDKVFNLLFLIISSSLRHTDMTMEIIQNSVETMQNFDAMGAAKAFKHLETIAKNLVRNPWKSGYKRIKTYSGFVKLKIDKCLKGTRTVFEALGYRKENNEFVLVKKICAEDKEMIALDCYVASVEMEIYKDIYERVRHHGYTYLDVHKCRQHCNEDAHGCEIWIMKHCSSGRNALDSTGNKPTNVNDLPGTKNLKPQFSLNQFKPRTHNDQSTSASKYHVRPNENISTSFSQGTDNFKVANDNHTRAYLNGKSEQNSFVPATIDDHVKESMKLLEKEKESMPLVPPPSYQSMYPSKAGNYDQDWGDVRMKIQGMGERFADPGGRGDILRGDTMVPSNDNISNLITKIPYDKAENNTSSKLPMENIASKYPSPPQIPVPINCGTESRRLYNIISDSRRMDVVADGPESPDECNPTSKQTKHNDLLNINTENTRERSTAFSTFGRSPEAKHSTEIFSSKHKLDPMNKRSQNVEDPGENDVYVSLREPSRTTLREGKPSFQDNFQQTTQRFYQADSFQSLPHFTEKNTNRSSILSRINKTVPPSSSKPAVMRSISEDKWQCQKCTYANEPKDNVCKVCGSSKEKGKDQPLKSGGNMCIKCTYVNDPGSSECKMCKYNLKNSPTYI